MPTPRPDVVVTSAAVLNPGEEDQRERLPVAKSSSAASA